ncbi:unnamed protein product [Dovyalis caffra]|uniref:1-deoxy-D-xylulose-5-phosphate synthase n=1 Tax=Dovyalis caffra TaxID=77055 RepID=A0AAV1S5L4_9ROSI|nr:unnamed protein product [Dovyalis caffra]
MNNLSVQELEKLADELREEIAYTVSKTGGHLSSSLGVVELTVALHHVFNSPEDKIIWDVGHQTYPHKNLTGRRSRMHTIRQAFGLAGFPKRLESEHDAFGTGHSSTSISAGLGMAVGRDLLGKENHVIAVIGDGAMTAGQAYEAMNNAGYLDSNLIIILNDNRQVSLPTATMDGPVPPVGALSKALTRLHSSRKFRHLREAVKASFELPLVDSTKQIGGQAQEIAASLDSYMRGMSGASGACLFEELGLYYIGPVDGHDVEDLVDILNKCFVTGFAGFSGVLENLVRFGKRVMMDLHLKNLYGRFQEQFGSGPGLIPGSGTCLMKVEGISPNFIKSIYKGSAALYRTEPWKRLRDELHTDNTIYPI